MNSKHKVRATLVHWKRRECTIFLPPSSGKQLRPLQSSLDCLLQCHAPLLAYPRSSEGEEEGSQHSLLALLVHRLQAVLKKMVAACMKKRSVWNYQTCLLACTLEQVGKVGR